MTPTTPPLLAVLLLARPGPCLTAPACGLGPAAAAGTPACPLPHAGADGRILALDAGGEEVDPSFLQAGSRMISAKGPMKAREAAQASQIEGAAPPEAALPEAELRARELQAAAMQAEADLRAATGMRASQQQAPELIPRAEPSEAAALQAAEGALAYPALQAERPFDDAMPTEPAMQAAGMRSSELQMDEVPAAELQGAAGPLPLPLQARQPLPFSEPPEAPTLAELQARELQARELQRAEMQAVKPQAAAGPAPSPLPQAQQLFQEATPPEAPMLAELQARELQRAEVQAAQLRPAAAPLLQPQPLLQQYALPDAGPQLAAEPPAATTPLRVPLQLMQTSSLRAEPEGELAEAPAPAPAPRSQTELELPECGSDCRDKVVLMLIELFGLYWCGCDRCYLGSYITGTLKAMTLGGFGLWAFADWMTLIPNALEKSSSINAMQMQATFTPKSLDGAMYLSLIFIVTIVLHVYGFWRFIESVFLPVLRDRLQG